MNSSQIKINSNKTDKSHKNSSSEYSMQQTAEKGDKDGCGKDGGKAGNICTVLHVSTVAKSHYTYHKRYIKFFKCMRKFN